MPPTVDALPIDPSDPATWLPWVAGIVVVYVWWRGLRWSRKLMSSASQPQTVVARTNKTPLEVVWSSFLGCLSYLLLLALPIAAGLIWFLMTR